MSYECKICNEWFNDHISFSNHIKKVHKLTVQSYYDTYLRKPNEGICKLCGNPTKYYGLGKGYADFCSMKCSNTANAQHNIHTDITCLICDKIISGNDTKYAVKNFSKHLQTEHNIYDPKIYYDTYIKQKNEGICPLCKNATEFKSVLSGYDKYCSVTCQQNHLKTIEGSHTNNISVLSNIRNTIKKIASNISEKYQNFLKNDKKTMWSDIRTDAITHNTIKNNKLVQTIDGTMAEVKTEISCSTERSEWIGTQKKYIPKKEYCTTDAFVDEIIECDDSINENEWCH